jgi:orotate phosphoribosyltransferase-like protein
MMDTPVERVSTLETDVAVIHSNYERRDEFSELKGKVDAGFAEVNGKMDAGFARVDAKIDRTTTTVLKWMFASQLSVAALVLAAVKYL